MSAKMPTVTSMLKTLSARGQVNYEKYEYVELTAAGAEVGGEMRRGHQILLKFLTEVLKIEIKTADAEACKMKKGRLWLPPFFNTLLLGTKRNSASESMNRVTSQGQATRST